MKAERWRPIPGYEGTYAASSRGRIRNVVTGRVLRGFHYKRDVPYLAVNLYRDRGPGRRRLRQHRVHRLVLAAFRGESRLETNHWNGQHDDNRLPNLKYATGSQNMWHAFNVIRTCSLAGERNNMARLTRVRVRSIRRRYAAGGISQAELGRRFGVGRAQINQIVHGRRWLGV